MKLTTIATAALAAGLLAGCGTAGATGDSSPEGALRATAEKQAATISSGDYKKTVAMMHPDCDKGEAMGAVLMFSEMIDGLKVKVDSASVDASGESGTVTTTSTGGFLGEAGGPESGRWVLVDGRWYAEGC